MKQLTICIDFDGTCVSHEFPFVGKDIGAQRVIKRLVDAGHKIILWTMRSDMKNPKPRGNDAYEIHAKGGNYLTQAVNWFKENDIPLYGINGNPTQKDWTESPKAYGNMFIDDAALGCPLILNTQYSARPYADWIVIERLLIQQGVLKED